MSAAHPGEGARETADTFTEVATIEDIPEHGLLAVTVPGLHGGTMVCLVKSGDAIYAVDDVCTHQAFPISAGEVRADGTVECIWHGARFDCATGAVRRGPAFDPLPTYAVRLEGRRIFVGPRQRHESA